MSYVTFAQNKDAVAFKSLVEETHAEKVVMVLEALKVEVASTFFNEEGGVSGGVSSVKKKPTPPAAGTVKLPGEGGKEGGLEHAGRSTSSGGEKTGDAVLPGQAVHSEEVIDEVSLRKAARTYAARSSDSFESGHSGDDDNSEKSYKKANKTLDRIEKKHGESGVKLAKRTATATIFGRDSHHYQQRKMGEEKSHGLDKVGAVQKDKAPKLPQKKGSGSAEDRKSMD